jgi:hypothetical protein
MILDLPNELLLQIVSNLSTANSVRSLSLCNQRLNRLVTSEGWKLFVKSQYPSIAPSIPPVTFSEAAKALTSFDRSWKRRGLLAFYIQPTRQAAEADIFNYPLTQPPARRNGFDLHGHRLGQTMGFQPIIDSREEIVGGEWHVRRDIVAWGAGAQIVVRSRECPAWSAAGRNARIPLWSVYLPHMASEGRDDITALKLLSPPDWVGYGGDGAISVLAGTAAGNLSVYELETSIHVYARLGRQLKFNTASTSPVRSLDITPSEKLAVAGFANGNLLLFDTAQPDPVSTAKMSGKDHIWDSKFLSSGCVAVGTGQSRTPMHVYAIDSTGFSEKPIRTWSARDGGISTASEDIEPGGSVSAIEAIPESSGPGNAGGQIFCSGNSDGTIRIHDLRSPADFELQYFDSVDDASIYSIATKGSNYLIAGSSRYSLLKMFDIRMDGPRSSHITPKNGEESGVRRHTDSDDPSGWSVYVHQNKDPRPTGRRRSIGSFVREARAALSPIYSVSSPAPFSPTLYVGLEEQVAQIDIVDCYEKHPDPRFGSPPVSHGKEARGFWDPFDRSRVLSYYEHEHPNRLRRQLVQWPSPLFAADKGYDIRWDELASPFPHFTRFF